MKKSVKLIVLFALLACILLPTLTACNVAEGGGTVERLVIYNWEDYIDPDMCDDFEAYYKEVTGRSIEITYTTFDTNETMMTKVLKNDANVDLICPSEYAIEKLLHAGCLLNHNDVLADISSQAKQFGLTFDGMSSLKMGYGNIEPDIMNVIVDMFGSFEDENGNPIKDASGRVLDMTEYMVPYFWGTLGILYNTSVISEEELEQYGWGILWNVQKNEKLENKILMKDSVRDSYAAAVFYMYEYGLLPDGYEDYSVQRLINCTDDVMLQAAEKALTEQRDHISGYEVDFGKDDMINEIVYADLAWSGDAMYAIEEGDYDEETDTYQLGYYVPSKASNIWYDGWVIPKSVNNKLAAMMFIDFMCQPVNGIRNSLEVCYSSAVAKDIIRADEEACAQLILGEAFDDNDNPLFFKADGKPVLDFEDIVFDENVNPLLYDSEGNAVEFDLDGYFENEVRYPEINETLGVMRDFGTQNDALVSMWQRAKSGNGIAPSLWWILLVIILAIALVIGAYFIAQALKLRPRKLKTDATKKE